MECSCNYFILLFFCKFMEVDGITGDANGQVRVLFGMLGGIDEHIAVEDVDVDVLSALTEVAVDDGAEVAVSCFGIVTERLRKEIEEKRESAIRKAKEMRRGSILANCSGRGDKDCAAIARYRGEDLYE